MKYFLIFDPMPFEHSLRIFSTLISTQFSIALFLYVSLIAAVPMPVIKLDGANVNGKTSSSVQEFLGIPFAQPP